MKTSNQATEGNEILLSEGVSSWPTIHEVVHDSSNSALIRYLDHLLGDPALMLAAAKRSHRHQLGFVKIVLAAEAAGPCLRLHFWDEESEAKEDIHSHCADFTSRVILGHLSENSYELTKGTEYACFRYRFDTANRCSSATAVGHTGAKVVTRRIMTAGDLYLKKSNELHNVGNAAKGTLTVSAWTARNSEALVLKSDTAAAAQDCSVEIGMSENNLHQIISSVRQEIMGQ
ncbi:hypothetical protein PsyrH_00985 [Pseudomonas syringae pv. syringae HS191]|uniref:hypothetical protein n=1 Tax=Pseudomonas syringae TaxID=317 RepID=UPI000624EE54|nr:hypothetical protein [Pseudomonas syringae]AKF49049.1 hypothetical protein PsyrH_00985 [Pseudomonas syringae pv. syringae HS191]MBI6707775.1 hypothetical protein [Pseudomonas syringae]MBI6783693.1 hypothetical protein [Pseudomonas syringae]MDU8599960.1 hypothetical protein [Pseudomonas syringae]RML69585.1 hypothetical protein ALQ91_03286 [Pseudomonas syringae pv. syringae]